MGQKIRGRQKPAGANSDGKLHLDLKSENELK